jgi:GNAT superfamily N-acetyltransferase
MSAPPEWPNAGLLRRIGTAHRPGFRLWGKAFYDWLFVELLFAPDFLRGRGLGAALLASAEEQACAWLCRFVAGHVQPPSARLLRAARTRGLQHLGRIFDAAAAVLSQQAIRGRLGGSLVVTAPYGSDRLTTATATTSSFPVRGGAGWHVGLAKILLRHWQSAKFLRKSPKCHELSFPCIIQPSVVSHRPEGGVDIQGCR